MWGGSGKDEACCPTCGHPFAVDLERPRLDRPQFPFCSERCRAIDLGRWLDEEYRISEPLLRPDGG